MPVERHFIGWHKPIVSSLCDFILPERLLSPVDLEKEIIVVPTRHAGRRLRDALILKCENAGAALFPPRTVEPSYFVRAESDRHIASQTAVLATWCEVLLNIMPKNYPGFFPTPPPAMNTSWAVETGELIQSLRNQLADGCITVGEIARDRTGDLEEPERWHDLSALEDLYLARLKEKGIEDPCISKISRAGAPQLEKDIEQVTVACTPDPSGLAIAALEAISASLPVRVLIHAPPDYSDFFDSWGRPIPPRWHDENIPIPEESRNMVACAGPEDQAANAIEIIREETPETGDDLSLSVPDRTLIPFMETAFAENGLSVFDPADRPLTAHPLYQVIESLFNLVNDGGYNAFAAHIRHPYVLAHMSQLSGATPAAILTELDCLQNERLPLNLTAMNNLVEEKPAVREEYPALASVIERVRQQVHSFDTMKPEDALREFLMETFETYAPHDRDNVRREFMNAATAVDDAMHEFVRERDRTLGGLENDAAFELLLRRLSVQTFTSPRDSSPIDMEGWLELAFSPAPLLIVTGMNEGVIPDTRLGDVFLPDSFRGKLGLRNDETRMARDAFLMKSLIESRRKEGRVVFLAGRTSARGDPLKPSRLLFRCGDSDLVERARRLFAPLPSNKRGYPHRITFKLDPNLPQAGVNADGDFRLSVTAFRDYLLCPFRFYLSRILGMEHLSDEKDGPDALDFGLIVHHALRKMAEDEEYRNCDDETRLGDFLAANAERWIVARYGKSHSLPVTVTLDATIQRLRAAAREQVRIVRDGWEIIRWEKVYEAELNGMKLKGQIDRVDRHRETGAIRIIDYKTMDRAVPPSREHLRRAESGSPEYAEAKGGKKGSRWVDLQLPLYIWLYSRAEGAVADIEPAYFALPKAVTETGLIPWDNFNEELQKSAVLCAGEIVKLIRTGVFWPPSETTAGRDDFAELFHGPGSDCFIPVKPGGVETGGDPE